MNLQSKIKISKRTNKKGVSAIIATVILIALVIGLVAIVWAIVTNLVKDKLGQTKDCFGNFDKITINERYTCYDLTNNLLYVSIAIADTTIDEVVVSVSGEGELKSFRINNIDKYDYAKNYVDLDFGGELILPEENSGKTYILDTSDIGLAMTPDVIKIAPVIGKNQCDVSDSVFSIEDCRTLEV